MKSRILMTELEGIMLLKAKLYTPGFRASSLVDDSFQRINPFPWRAILCRIGNVQKLGNTNVTNNARGIATSLIGLSNLRLNLCQDLCQ